MVIFHSEKETSINAEKASDKIQQKKKKIKSHLKTILLQWDS